MSEHFQWREWEQLLATLPEQTTGDGQYERLKHVTMVGLDLFYPICDDHKEQVNFSEGIPFIHHSNGRTFIKNTPNLDTGSQLSVIQKATGREVAYSWFTSDFKQQRFQISKDGDVAIDRAYLTDDDIVHVESVLLKTRRILEAASDRKLLGQQQWMQLGHSDLINEKDFAELCDIGGKMGVMIDDIRRNYGLDYSELRDAIRLCNLYVRGQRND
jgi:hypothetical protein